MDAEIGTDGMFPLSLGMSTRAFAAIEKRASVEAGDSPEGEAAG